MVVLLGEFVRDSGCFVGEVGTISGRRGFKAPNMLERLRSGEGRRGPCEDDDSDMAEMESLWDVAANRLESCSEFCFLLRGVLCRSEIVVHLVMFVFSDMERSMCVTAGDGVDGGLCSLISTILGFEHMSRRVTGLFGK